MRCESQRQLYPISNTAKNKNKFSSKFAALSTSIWHDRLGHPEASILDSLRKNKMIDCIVTSKSNSTPCHSCPLGRTVWMYTVADYFYKRRRSRYRDYLYSHLHRICPCTYSGIYTFIFINSSLFKNYLYVLSL
ncbi:unnamed protein product [Trifolium pratense]|uniref:Uncharacterized protein n=1 Tax=Trifolium pratense TaxID=57577 RepID=A0ACB0M8I5_TRIPR|nr:unnamed protein product [Trifolium pratense]